MTDTLESTLQQKYAKNMHWVKNQELFAREELLIYIDGTHPRKVEPVEGQTYLHQKHSICASRTGGYCCCSGVTDFQHYGAGIILYFKYLKYFSVFFLIASILFSIPIMVVYYGSGPLTSEAGNFFNNFLSATTISNIGSGLNLMTEATEGDPLILKCPEGSKISGIKALYGDPKGEIDCPVIQQPNINGKCTPLDENNVCRPNDFCYSDRHPTSKSKCCWHEKNHDEELNEQLVRNNETCQNNDVTLILLHQCAHKSECTFQFPSEDPVDVKMENCPEKYYSNKDKTCLIPFTNSTWDDYCLSTTKRLIVTAECYSEFVIGPMKIQLKKTYVLYFISIMDFALIFIFFFVWYWFVIAEKTASVRSIRETQTVRDYTIMITSLPRHISIAQLYFWIKSHFDHLLKTYDHPLTDEVLKHGKISDINFGYTTEGDGINLYNMRGSLLLEFQTLEIKQKGLGDWDMQELRNCQRERKKLDNKLRILDAKIDVWESGLQARAAFVTFEREEASSYIKQVYASQISCCAGHTYQDLKLHNKRITVNSAVDPSDIKWENIGVSPCSSCCRSFLTAIISFLMIVISFIIVYVAKIYQGQLTDEYDSVDCSIFTDDQLSIPNIVLDNFAPQFNRKIGNTGKLGCYCWNYFLSSPTMVVKAEFNLPLDKDRYNQTFIDKSLDIAKEAIKNTKNPFDYSDPEYDKEPLCNWNGKCGHGLQSHNNTHLCSSYVSNLALGQGLTLVSVLAVVVINSVLRIFIYMLIAFERKKSGSEELASLVVKIFISQFLNTAIIILLVNWNLERWGISLELFSGFQLLGGKFDIFSIKWYGTIGVSIVITMIINILSGVSSPIIAWITRGFFIWIDRGFSFDPLVTRQKTMTDLQNIYTGGVFFLEQSYAWTLNTLYVCFIYCLGCPFLIIILFVSFVVKFWADKIGFLRIYRTPDMFDYSLPTYVTQIIPWAFLLHVVFSLLLFSDDLAFQEKPLDLLNEFTSSLSGITDFLSDSNLQFLSKLISTVPHLIILFLLLVLYALFVILSKCVSCKNCSKSSQIFKGLKSYETLLPLNFLIKSLKGNYIKVSNDEKFVQLAQTKKAELHTQNPAIDYDDDSENVEIGLTGIPTYDLCDNTKFIASFSLALDANIFHVRAPLDVLAESYENQKRRDESMFLLKKSELSAKNVQTVETLFDHADSYQEGETTVDDLAQAIHDSLPKATYDSCCCSKPPKIEKTICYTLAKQLYTICDVDFHNYLQLSLWVNEIFHFTEDFNGFEFFTFQSILNPKIESVLSVYMWELIDRSNTFQKMSGNVRVIVANSTIELVNGEYKCIGRRNGAFVFCKGDGRIILHRVYYKDSYLWRFTQLLDSYYDTVAADTDMKDPVIVDRNEYIFQSKEILSLGLPPLGGYAYTNPHDTDVHPPNVHTTGEAESLESKKINIEKRKKYLMDKDKIEKKLETTYNEMDKFFASYQQRKDESIQEEDAMKLILKNLKDLGETSVESAVQLRNLSENVADSKSTPHFLQSSTRLRSGLERRREREGSITTTATSSPSVSTKKAVTSGVVLNIPPPPST